MWMGQVTEFKYLGCVLNDSDLNVAECYRKVVSGKKGAGGINPLVNARSL